MATESNSALPAGTTPVGVVNPPPAVTVSTSALPMTVPMNHAERPEKFDGSNFKRWQQKMQFYLTTLNLVRFLTEDAPQLKEGDNDIQVVSAVDAWKHSDFLCRNYVMNGLTDSLYNVYSTKKTAKEL